MLDTIVTPDNVERKLGLLLPTQYPLSTTYNEAFPTTKLTINQIREELAKRPDRTAWKRRERFVGKKYIRNQGQFGACNGWSTSGVMSRARELRGEPYVCLSGADAYSQMNGGRDQGSVLSDGLEKVLPAGIAPESMVPFDRIYTHQIPALAIAARQNYRGTDAFAVDSEVVLASAILLGEMAVIAVHATNAFNQQDGNGLNLGGNGVGNHSTMVQDIRLSDDGTIEFDMANSWDTTWGDGGCTWLRWNNHLRETVKYHRFWVLVSTNDDTSDASKPPKIAA